MKIRDRLDEILNQTSKIKILRFLFTEKDEHTGRGIAKAIDMSASSIHSALQEMEDTGIISARKKGNAILYKIKEKNHFVNKLLAPLFEKEKSIYSDVASFIKKGLFKEREWIVTIAVFGSVASGLETSGSDIDLAVITKNAPAKNRIYKLIDILSIDMAKKFGVAVSPYVLTKAEIRQKYIKGKPIIKSIVKNNKLIYGEPIERILA